MRILHVTDGFSPQVGGIEIFVEDLARHQAMAGHDVSVLTATPGDGRADPGTVRVVRTPSTLAHPLAAAAARVEATTGLFDVVHSHLSVVSPFATVVARASDEAGLATVNTVHSMWGSRRLVVRAVRTLADWDRSTTVWTAVSAAAAAEKQRVFPREVGVQVVHNAVDVDWWRAGHPAADPIGSTPGPVTLVSVMRIARRKRPGALLAMVRALRERLPDDVGVRLVVAGDGPLTHRVGSDIVRLGLDTTVAMLGGLDRAAIRDLYAGADVFVSPVLEESFGIAALEARAYGLPVVAMAAGGVREFVEHGVSGLLCDDDAAMVEALMRISIDADLRHSIADHNAAVRPEQDWALAVSAFDAAYDRARLSAHRTRRSTALVTGRTQVRP
jgi:glycosyltransferase involved in cell wall biosynthesis